MLPEAFKSKMLFELVPCVKPFKVPALMAKPVETIGWRGDMVSKDKEVALKISICR